MPRRLPAAPLHRVLRKLRAAESLTWDELADRVGVTPRHLFRLLAAQSISDRVADRIACRVGLHPVLLWPAEWLRTDAEARCGRPDSKAV
jgi:transcriptional regulator with XRE-family HTH domain